MEGREREGTSSESEWERQRGRGSGGRGPRLTDFELGVKGPSLSKLHDDVKLVVLCVLQPRRGGNAAGGHPSKADESGGLHRPPPFSFPPNTHARVFKRF